MNIYKELKIEPEELIKMSQKEFFEKTISVFEKLTHSYYQGWQCRALEADEYPEESVCDKCTGRGVFLKNGEKKECVQDIDEGDCFYTFCDYEQVGIDLESNINYINDLLLVDEIVNTDNNCSDCV